MYIYVLTYGLQLKEEEVTTTTVSVVVNVEC